jgi:Leu/Phe-tRNA-protein transferase
MKVYPLVYTPSGHILISPGDDPDRIMDEIVATGYDMESCLAPDFDPDFAARLIAAGFLVMSVRTKKGNSTVIIPEPMHHLNRSVLLFDELHESRSAKRLLSRYELKAGAAFDTIIEKCRITYGDAWLTRELIDLLLKVRKLKKPDARLFSFGVYREGKLRAGEFGTISGRVYTSYSGYHDENSAGTVQMILTAHWLRENGFAFWDLGMPLPYKETLGARVLNIENFLRLWRKARKPLPLFLQ